MNGLALDRAPFPFRYGRLIEMGDYRYVNVNRSFIDDGDTARVDRAEFGPSLIVGEAARSRQNAAEGSGPPLASVSSRFIFSLSKSSEQICSSEKGESPLNVNFRF